MLVLLLVLVLLLLLLLLLLTPPAAMSGFRYLNVFLEGEGSVTVRYIRIT